MSVSYCVPAASAGKPIAAANEKVRRALFALNNAHARETSLLDTGSWTSLVENAFAALTMEPPSALVIALDQDADYASPNFQWFRARYPRFVYIDRVVVARQARGRGIARSLYSQVIAEARRSGHDILACEVNRVPPNPVSDAFHAHMGFSEVGRAYLPDDGLEAIAHYAVPTTLDLEDREIRETVIYRLGA